MFQRGSSNLTDGFLFPVARFMMDAWSVAGITRRVLGATVFQIGELELLFGVLGARVVERVSLPDFSLKLT